MFFDFSLFSFFFPLFFNPRDVSRKKLTIEQKKSQVKF